jgi:hypothetical protein
VDDYEQGVDVQVLRSKFQEAARQNDMSRAIVWAGAAVGEMKDLKPAKVSSVFHQMKIFIDDLLSVRRSFRSCTKSAWLIWLPEHSSFIFYVRTSSSLTLQYTYR